MLLQSDSAALLVTGCVSPGAGQSAAPGRGKRLGAGEDSQGEWPLGFPMQNQARGPAESQGKRQSIPTREKKMGNKARKHSWR